MSKLRILGYVLNTRFIGRCISSFHALQLPAGVTLDLVFHRDDTPVGVTTAQRWEQITQRMAAAQRHALAQDYDAILSLEDDILVPRDALAKLLAVDGDIVYANAVQRLTPTMWHACLQMDEDSIETLDRYPERARAVFGEPIDVVGVGGYCTLIRRSALEAIPFQRRGAHSYDRYLGMDAAALGFRQKYHTGILCSHFSYTPSPRFFTPDINEPALYRTELVE